MTIDYDKDQLAYALANALKERDEAREDLEHWKSEYEIVVSRLCGIKHERDNGIIAENEIIPVLRKERDDAREAFVIATDQMVIAQGKVREANKERDEARERHATEATEHMLAVNKLCGEKAALEETK